MVTVPAKYADAFRALEANEVSFGFGELRLFAPDELESAQIGYAVSSEGESLVNGTDGAWRAEWLVIGHDLALGDPILIDISDAALPVYTSPHGEGFWELVDVSPSLEQFARQFRAFTEIAKGRSNPAELEHNPLSEGELKRFVEAADGEPSVFWLLQLEVDLDAEDADL